MCNDCAALMEYIQSLLEQDKQRRDELYRQQQEYGRLMTEYMDAKREIARLKEKQ